MPEYVKSLVVVLGIAMAVFVLAAPSLVGHTIVKSDYWRRVAVWCAATMAAFLAHDFWVFAIIAGALLAFGAGKDRKPMAFYCALLLTVPPLGSSIAGLGVFNYLFDLNYLRLLNLTVLLPAAWQLFSIRNQRLPAPKLPDVLLVSYLMLLFILTVLAVPLTSALRQGFYLFIDVWLVYYVASRSVRTMDSLREVISAFVLGATIMAVIANFEAVRGWLLYATLESSLGVIWGYGNYMGRGLDGPLRVMASTGHPIVMGYLIVVSIPLLIFLKPTIRSTFLWWLTLTVSVAALAATVSRGPWVGAVAMALVFASIGKGAAKRFMWLGVGVAAAAALAQLSDWGRGLIEYLPFIGSVSSETVDYRQRLFEVSMSILLHSPFFGEPGFYSNAAAQELRHEGLIDVVNSYLGIAVGSGFVGLGLFVGLFVCAIVLASRACKSSDREPQTGEVARALLAAIIGILVTIGTTSSINVISPIYFVIIGLTVGYCGEFLMHGSFKGRFAGGDSDGMASRAYTRPLPANAG